MFGWEPGLRGGSKESPTFHHSQVHDHLLVIEDPVDVDPAAVRTSVCPSNVQYIQIHLSIQDVSRQPVPVRNLQHQGRHLENITLTQKNTI